MGTKRARLDRTDLPAQGWTPKTTSERWPTAWGNWTMKNTGQLSGQRVIRVHSALRAPKRQVSDEMLEYLLFHEMLHDLLPGQGHDAEFRRLEALWPGSAALDLAFDTMHERYRMPSPSPTGSRSG